MRAAHYPDVASVPPSLRPQVERLLAGKRPKRPVWVEAPGRPAKDASGEQLRAAFLTQLKRLAPGMPAPKEEQLWHPKRKWSLDFSWPVEKVAVECDGGTRMVRKGKRGGVMVGGSHNSDRDRWRSAEAAALEWLVFRVTPSMLRQDPGRFVRLVETAVARRRAGGC